MIHGTAARDAYTYAGLKYGGTRTYTEELSYAPSLYDNVGLTTAEESKDYYTSPTTLRHNQKGSLTITQTYYNITVSSSYLTDEIFHSLIFGTNTIYWLATRCSFCDEADGSFGLRFVISSNIGGEYLFYSFNGSYSAGYVMRPVVTLGADVKISEDGGTAGNPRILSI